MFPTPPGPPSAFRSKLPLVNVVTFAIKLETGVLLVLFVKVALKLNSPTKPDGQPEVLGLELKVDSIGMGLLQYDKD